MTETKLTARLVKCWQQMGCEVINIHGNNFQAPGWPDVFVCSKNWTGFIEFKGPSTVTMPHQTRILARLEKSPCPACIVRFVNVQGELWSFAVERSSGEVVLNIAIAGTDGQVAAGLLRELAIFGV